MDIKKLLTAANQAELSTIGTRKEKLLHRALKYLISNNPRDHEIKIGSFYVDVMLEQHIYEIQTQAFNVIAQKIENLLQNYQVTIVYPICVKKKISYVDEQGECTTPRMSPQKGRPLDFCYEAYKIKKLLKNVNLTFKIVLYEGTLYRKQSPTTKHFRKKTTKYQMIPTKFIEILELPNDFIKIIPVFDSPFTSEDFKKKTNLSKKNTQCALNILYYLGYLKRVGKIDRFYLYELNNAFIKP